MAAKITDKITDAVSDVAEDIGYKTSRLGAMALGKATAPLVGEFVGWSLATVIGLATGFASGVLDAGLVSIAVIATFTALSAAVSQSDHLHRRKLLLNEYREEIGAAVGKAPKDVTEADMHRLAEGDVKAGIIANPALKESLAHSANERNLGVVLSSVASVGSFFLVNYFMAGHENPLEKAFKAPGVVAGLNVVAQHAGEIAMHALAGMAAYFAIKEPLHIISTKVLGLSKETVQERIEGIRKAHVHGRAVTPEQVMEVCLDARPEIAEQIENTYGKSFEALKEPERQQVLKVFGKELEVDALAKDVNSNRIKPEELAFAAYGQASGVAPKAPEAPKADSDTLARLWRKFTRWGQNASTPAMVQAEAERIIDALPGVTEVRMSASPDGKQEAFLMRNIVAEPGSKNSFVAMVARGESGKNTTYVERLVRSSVTPLQESQLRQP